MPAPISNILITTNPNNPLETTFQGGNSLNGEVITSYAWNFGDSTTDTGQIATHEYSASGIYLITLTVANSDGSTQSAMYFSVSSDFNTIQPIINLVEYKVPAQFLNYSAANTYIKKWQLHLQPQVTPEVLDADVFTESAWPPLFNILLSELVVLDLITDKTTQGMMSVALGNSSTVGGGTVETAGDLKYFEAGPSKAEFYNSNQLDLEKQTEFARIAFLGDDGMLANYRMQICIIARRLSVSLPFCPYTPKVKTFIKAGRPCKGFRRLF